LFPQRSQGRRGLAIRFADKLVCALHHALTFFEPFDFIDELFSSIWVIAKDDHVRLGGGRSPAKVCGFIVMFLRLGEMLIDALKVSRMAFLRMVTHQNWLTKRDFSSRSRAAKCRPVAIFACFSASCRKRAAFAARSDSKSFMP
jgi:hypothetical protein